MITEVISLYRKFSYVGGGQLLIRLLRLVTIIVVARIMIPEDYGFAALILAVNEVFHAFSHGSVNSKLIQAEESQLARLKTDTFYLTMLVCGVLFLMQVALAFPISYYYGQDELVEPVMLLAIVYLILPFSSVQGAMLIREGKLEVVAKAEIYQAIAEATLVLLLALWGAGFWALVLPKLLVAPVWVLYVRQQYLFTPEQRFSIKEWRSILSFGVPIAIVDILHAIRLHAVTLIIGWFLGVEALGLFYFAMNAGLGVSMSIIKALNQVLFYHLCNKSRSSRGHLDIHIIFQAFIISLIAVCPIVTLQISLAEAYVPLLFGEKWVEAGVIPVLSVLCLTAVPLTLISVVSQAMRAEGRTGLDLTTQFWVTVTQLLFVFVFSDQGLEAISYALLSSTSLCALLIAAWFIIVEWRKVSNKSGQKKIGFRIKPFVADKRM